MILFSDPEVLSSGHGPASASAGDGFPGPRDEQGEGVGAAHEETRAGEKKDGRPDGRNEGVKRKHEVSPEQFCMGWAGQGLHEHMYVVPLFISQGGWLLRNELVFNECRCPLM